jgi:hypothetical protein
MTQAKFDEFSGDIKAAVRSRSHHRMDHVLYQLWSCPGLNGIRVQIGQLTVSYRAEVKRSSIKDAPTPPKKLFYLRRIPHRGITVKQLLTQQKLQA